MITGIPVEAQVLRDAEKCICTERKDQYGAAEDNFKNIADVANVLFQRKLNDKLTARDVALFMVALKLCREANCPKYDNLVDGAGYFALVARIDAKTQQQ